MTSRKPLSRTARARIFDAAKGLCHICGLRIQAGERWDAEHVQALAFDGEDSEANLRPAHIRCHQIKTAEEHTRRAKADRQRWNHLGIRKQAKRKIPSRPKQPRPLKITSINLPTRAEVRD